MTPDRRQLLLAAAATTLAPSAAFAQGAGSPHDQLNALFDRFMATNLDRSPETVTSLGMDKGARAAQKARLDDRSLEGVATDQKIAAEQLAAMDAFDRKSLKGMDALNYDIIRFGLADDVAAAKRFKYAGGNAGSPYVLNQLGGAYRDLPDFLDSQHAIETKDDADAYLSRLAAMAVAVDQESERQRHDEGLGVFAPDFALDKTLKQIISLRDTPTDKSVLVQSVASRAKEKNIPGDWGAQAAGIWEQKVRPALDRQAGLAQSLRAKATHDAGVWRLPDGQAYYEASVVSWTTSRRTAADIHKTGLDLVAQLSARMDELMKAQGLTKGTVGQRLRGMYDDPKFRYPNTDEGKAKLLADLNGKVQVVQAKLPQWFGTLPKAKVEIKRIPPAIELGASGGYYQPGALDGSRAGSYYINLRDTAEQPSWTLPTLTYHEAIPGHHLQLSLQQETDLPLIRRVSGFSGYIEGWALYAEQLADEMGMYETDPWGRIGYLHDAALRAVRLVLDTGMHAMRWPREKAVAYFVETIGDLEPAAVSEVERYCVWPGQACGYMLGKLQWLKSRSEAKAKLGSKFDIKAFHDRGLLRGAMPLEVLDQVMAAWIAERSA